MGFEGDRPRSKTFEVTKNLDSIESEYVPQHLVAPLSSQEPRDSPNPSFFPSSPFSNTPSTSFFQTGDTGADSDGSIDFQGSPISSSRRGNGEARALSLEDELSSPEIHPPSRTASTSVAPEDPSLAADDGPRVSLNLRAKGGLSWTALARPTTVMSKLVAGFLDAQKDQVKLTPAERAKCRIEFEGDVSTGFV